MPSIMPTGKQQFTNNAGVPLAGGRIFTFEAGTTTPKATYSDAAGITANPNPIVLNARGEALVFWSGAYDVKITDASGVTIYTVSNYQAPVMPGDLSANDGAEKIGGTWFGGIKAKLSDLATQIGASLIGFIQGAVGAEVRNVQDKLSDTVSVFDFMTEEQIADVRVRAFAVDVTAPLQACLDHCHAKGRTMFVPGGGYRITKQIKKPSSFEFPNIVGEGFKATEFRSYGLDAGTSILFSAGGSGGLAGAIISGVLFSSDDGLANALEFDGQCGVTIRDCQFGKLAIGLLAHNKSVGSFTEFVVAENCDFTPECVEALVYRRTGGNDSFHGTGLRNCTVVDSETGAVVPKVRIGGSDSTSNNIIVYNAPLSGQFWKHKPVAIIQNNSTRFATNFHGNITLELFNDAQSSTWDMCAGTNRTYLLGAISSLQPYARRGQLILCDTFETRDDGTVNALIKPYQIAPVAMAAGDNNIATLYVTRNETYLVRVELADEAGPAKKTYLLVVNFALNAPASVTTLVQLLDYFGGSMPYPTFSISGTTLVATAEFAATVKCSATVTKIGISGAFGL